MNNEKENDTSKYSVDALKQAAEQGDWVLIDSVIPQIVSNQEFLNWSLREGLQDINSDIRDLAVSILEKSNIQLDGQTVERLKKIMFEDENIHVRNRASFTLFSHNVRTEQVIKALHLALSDPEVSAIAQNYINIAASEI